MQLLHENPVDTQYSAKKVCQIDEISFGIDVNSCCKKFRAEDRSTLVQKFASFCKNRLFLGNFSRELIFRRLETVPIDALHADTSVS